MPAIVKAARRFPAGKRGRPSFPGEDVKVWDWYQHRLRVAQGEARLFNHDPVVGALGLTEPQNKGISRGDNRKVRQGPRRGAGCDIWLSRNKIRSNAVDEAVGQNV